MPTILLLLVLLAVGLQMELEVAVVGALVAYLQAQQHLTQHNLIRLLLELVELAQVRYLQKALMVQILYLI
jgi:hypothetical protein